ncbi:MAG: hypothetical protein AAF211_03995 [Myxococcota bacterium]
MKLLPLVALAACAMPLDSETPPVAPDSPAPPADGSCVEGLEVGQCAPDFTLLNADGTPVRLADRVGDRLVVVGSSLW